MRLHETLVDERKVDKRDVVLQLIFDAARRVHDVAVLRKVALSTVERVTMCIQADSGHFEHLLS
jgi:hypothetical protein